MMRATPRPIPVMLSGTWLRQYSGRARLAGVTSLGRGADPVVVVVRHASDAGEVGQRAQVRQREVRRGLGRRGRPARASCRRSIQTVVMPRPWPARGRGRGSAPRAGCARGGVDRPERDSKGSGRLVAPACCGCDHPVELHAEPLGRQREQVVVAVGDGASLKRLEARERLGASPRRRASRRPRPRPPPPRPRWA